MTGNQNPGTGKPGDMSQDKSKNPASATPGSDYGDTNRDRPGQPAETRQRKEGDGANRQREQQGQGGQQQSDGQQRAGGQQQSGGQQAAASSVVIPARRAARTRASLTTTAR